jgi:hypothetical protein
VELNPRELALLEFLLRRRSEVVSKREILELFHGRLRPGSAGEKLDHSLADAGQSGAKLHEHLGGDALTLADQAEQQVLGAEVVVVEQPGFVLGKHNDPSSPVGEGSGHRPHSRNSTAAPSHLARYTHGKPDDSSDRPGHSGFDSSRLDPDGNRKPPPGPQPRLGLRAGDVAIAWAGSGPAGLEADRMKLCWLPARGGRPASARAGCRGDSRLAEGKRRVVAQRPNDA